MKKKKDSKLCRTALVNARGIARWQAQCRRASRDSRRCGTARASRCGAWLSETGGRLRIWPGAWTTLATPSKTTDMTQWETARRRKNATPSLAHPKLSKSCDCLQKISIFQNDWSTVEKDRKMRNENLAHHLVKAGLFRSNYAYVILHVNLKYWLRGSIEATSYSSNVTTSCVFRNKSVRIQHENLTRKVTSLAQLFSKNLFRTRIIKSKSLRKYFYMIQDVDKLNEPPQWL